MKITIVEDDASYVKQLKEYLGRYSSEYGLSIDTEVFSNGMDFATDYRADSDIVLLDIEMPFMNGLDAAAKIREFDNTVAILFITNMAQYAIKGYEVHAVDFIVKPISYFNFADKLTKAVRYAKRDSKKEIVIKSESALVRMPTSSILFVEKDRNILVYHTLDGEYRERGTMQELESRLAGDTFSVCTSGCVVNLRHVKKTTPSTVTVGDTELPISRRRSKDFFSDTMNFLSGG